MSCRSCFLLVAVAVLVLGEVSPLPATPITFTENLGNFPHAIATGAEFGTFAGRNINGTTINATGFLFHLANTSFGNGAHSDGSGQVTSAPSGFQKGLDPLDPATGLREINFRINLANGPNALIFDPTAPSIPSVFTNPRTGTFDFFVSTPPGFTLASLPTIRNDPGIDIKTQMAWVSNGAVQTGFPNLGEDLAPRGQLEAVPEPSTLILMGLGLGGLGSIAWRRRRRK